MATHTTYDDLLARVRLLSADLDRPPVVAISGHGGAGKSTRSTALAADLGVDEEQVVRLDRLKAGVRPSSGDCSTSTTGRSCSTCCSGCARGRRRSG